MNRFLFNDRMFCVFAAMKDRSGGTDGRAAAFQPAEETSRRIRLYEEFTKKYSGWLLNINCF